MYQFALHKTLIILILFMCFIKASSQDENKSIINLALDVTPFMYKGFSAKVGLVPKLHPKTDIALEVFSINIPESVINLNETNANKGWTEKVKPGIAIYYDRKLGEKKNSFWLGGGIVYLNHLANNQSENNQYNQIEYLLRANYKWFPFTEKGFYLNPYCALAYRHKVSGNNGSYALSPFLIIPSIYISLEL